jgi:hypothetical protein
LPDASITPHSIALLKMESSTPTPPAPAPAPAPALPGAEWWDGGVSSISSSDSDGEARLDGVEAEARGVLLLVLFESADGGEPEGLVTGAGSRGGSGGSSARAEAGGTCTGRAAAAAAEAMA